MKLFAALGLLASLATVTWALENNVLKKIKNGIVLITVDGSSANLQITREDGTVFEQHFNTASTSKSMIHDTLTLLESCETNTTCINTSNNEPIIKIKTSSESEVIRINHVLPDPNAQLIDCFSLTDNTQWFGGPEIGYQIWPIQDQYYEELTPTSGSVQLFERYWLSSKGVYILVDLNSPLFLDQNHIKDRHLCLVAKNKSPYRHRNTIRLDYEIGVFANPRVAQEHVIKTHFDKPSGHPDARSVTHPIWSTWARYKIYVNESVVRKFADEIVNNGFKNSQLEIDDNWETCYGSFNVDKKTFPDMKNLVADLEAKGFRVTLWIHPFINIDCNDGEAYNYALKNDYFVKNTNGKVDTSWWNGKIAGAIDFTNPRAAEWWVARVKKLLDFGFHSFKFDAGDSINLPKIINLNASEELQPDIYANIYSSILAKHFDDNIEVRVGWRTQQLPIWVRMSDKATGWTFDNGLPTLITTLLQMNLNGYVLALPDMIGGNGYVNGSQTETELPSKELFIRWLQANVFMPSLQYSFTPWDFDAETISLSKIFTDMHANVSSKIIELMDKAVQTGAPINPPIWWIDPTNVEAHKIGDEYLLGEDILVAPIIAENATSRDVYLPSGKWRDGNNQEIRQGPIWLRNYPAPLSVLPHFYRL